VPRKTGGGVQAHGEGHRAGMEAHPCRAALLVLQQDRGWMNDKHKENKLPATSKREKINT
jgi:hypothetical protein